MILFNNIMILIILHCDLVSDIIHVNFDKNHNIFDSIEVEVKESLTKLATDVEEKQKKLLLEK